MANLGKSEEYYEIARQLEQFHNLFYTFWELGKPTFTEKIETACVTFDKEGGYLNFYFNPQFWDSLTPYECLFVICHEILHVVYKHGPRIINASNPDIANKAADIVVNHALVDKFQFDRNRIGNWERLCWVDTLWPGETVPKDECLEYYYIKLLENHEQGCELLTAHDALQGVDSNELDNFVISNLEKACEKAPNDHLDTLEKLASSSDFAGTEDGKTLLHIVEACKKRSQVNKWESIITNWTSKQTTRLRFELEDTWTKPNKRVRLKDSSLFLPGETEQANDKKARIHLFIDVSSSCYLYAPRFFEIARNIPTDLFEINAYAFDTVTKKLDLSKSFDALAGGGTSFQILEQQIINDIGTDLKSYPDAVFVITDGFGDSFSPAIPDRWHWLLVNRDYGYSSLATTIPLACTNRYKADNFE